MNITARQHKTNCVEVEATRLRPALLTMAKSGRIPCLAKCSPGTLAFLASISKFRSLKPGESLIRRGEKSEKLVLIIKGLLKLSFTAPNAHRHIAGYLVPGNLYNQLSLFDGLGSAYDCDAKTAVVVALFDKTHVSEMLATDPAFSTGVIQSLCERARTHYLDLIKVSLLSIRERCALTLLTFARQFGVQQANGIFISFKLAQHAFADIIGCSRPVLNQELQSLRQMGAIEVANCSVTIVDASKLHSIVPEGLY